MHLVILLPASQVRSGPKGSSHFPPVNIVAFSTCAIWLNGFYSRQSGVHFTKKQQQLIWQKHSPNPKLQRHSLRNTVSQKSKPSKFSITSLIFLIKTRRTLLPCPESASSFSSIARRASGETQPPANRSTFPQKKSSNSASPRRPRMPSSERANFFTLLHGTLQSRVLFYFRASFAAVSNFDGAERQSAS